MTILFSLLLAATVFADDDFHRARHLGVLSQSVVVEDHIGRHDHNDYFRFTLNQRRRVRIILDELFEDANLGLYDNSGRVLKTSLNRGAQREELSGVLEPGVYFIRVAAWRSPQGYWSDTPYRLRVRSRYRVPADFGGNSLETATSIGDTYLRQGRPFEIFEWIGHSGDHVDFYRFQVIGPQQWQQFAARVNLPRRARLELFYYTGNAHQPWRLYEVSHSVGHFSQELRLRLNPNEYILGVFDPTQKPVQYQLQMYTSKFKNQPVPF